MDWILFTLLLVTSIVICWAAQEVVTKRNIRVPKAYTIAGHILYGLLLVAAYILL
ncbi:MAG: hypothetical protein ACFFB7_04665 [Candidatus Sifarchaeia archaeon]